MMKDDAAVFHAFASKSMQGRIRCTGGAWNASGYCERAALKLKGLCITARRNGSTTDGSISQKAGNLAAGETAT